MKKALTIGLAVIAATSLTWAAAVAQGRRSDTVVTTKARLEKSAAGKSVVVISLDIKPGWHLYANPVGNEDLDGSQVVVTFADAKAEIVYPAGKEVTDKDLGKYKIYEDKVEIRATLDRAIGATAPVELIVQISACDDKNCLPPAKVKLTVP
jgi:DsbC/DsbD-like thiol-disulfide interchange protein